MPAAVGLRPDWEAKRVRAAAREVKDADQVRRLLAIAAADAGQERTRQERTRAAKIGAMDPQRLRDWVRRFNAAGPDGLMARKPAGAARRLSAEQEAELAALIERMVRWRRVDLQQLILTRWNIAYHERTIGKLWRRLGFRHIPARPRPLGQDPVRIEEFKKTSPSEWERSRQSSPRKRPSKSGFKTRCASAGKTRAPGAGRDAAPDHGRSPICAPSRPIYSARSVPNAAPGRRSSCRAPTRRRCSTILTRSRAALLQRRRPSSCSTKPAGIRPKNCAYQRTSPCCHCRPNRLS